MVETTRDLGAWLDSVGVPNSSGSVASACRVL